MKEKSQALLLLSSSTNQSVIFFYKSLLFEIISVKNIFNNKPVYVIEEEFESKALAIKDSDLDGVK